MHFNDLVKEIQEEAGCAVAILYAIQISDEWRNEQARLRRDDLGGQTVVRRREVVLQALRY